MTDAHNYLHKKLCDEEKEIQKRINDLNSTIDNVRKEFYSLSSNLNDQKVYEINLKKERLEKEIKTLELKYENDLNTKTEILNNQKKEIIEKNKEKQNYLKQLNEEEISIKNHYYDLKILEKEQEYERERIEIKSMCDISYKEVYNKNQIDLIQQEDLNEVRKDDLEKTLKFNYEKFKSSQKFILEKIEKEQKLEEERIQSEHRIEIENLINKHKIEVKSLENELFTIDVEKEARIKVLQAKLKTKTELLEEKNTLEKMNLEKKNELKKEAINNQYAIFEAFANALKINPKFIKNSKEVIECLNLNKI